MTSRPASYRRSSATMLLALVLLLPALGGCAGDAGPSATGDCGHWCGQASATVTFQGSTVTISGGGCYDDGSSGMDIRIGDWQGDGTADYLMLIGYRPGGPTAPPGANATDQAGNPLSDPPISGSVGGNPFIVTSGATVSLSSATSGTFSGDDTNDQGPVTGTFVCH